MDATALRLDQQINTRLAARANADGNGEVIGQLDRLLNSRSAAAGEDEVRAGRIGTLTKSRPYDSARFKKLRNHSCQLKTVSRIRWAVVPGRWRTDGGCIR